MNARTDALGVDPVVLEEAGVLAGHDRLEHVRGDVGDRDVLAVLLVELCDQRLPVGCVHIGHLGRRDVPDLVRHPVDHVGGREHAEAGDADQRERDGGDDDARDEAGTEEWGKIAGDLEGARNHSSNVGEVGTGGPGRLANVVLRQPRTCGDTGEDLRHHGDAELGPGLVDLAVNVRPAPMPAWLARAAAGLAGPISPRYPDPGPARRGGRRAGTGGTIGRGAADRRRGPGVHPAGAGAAAAARGRGAPAVHRAGGGAAGRRPRGTAGGPGRRRSASTRPLVPAEADLVVHRQPDQPDLGGAPGRGVARAGPARPDPGRGRGVHRHVSAGRRAAASLAAAATCRGWWSSAA